MKNAKTNVAKRRSLFLIALIVTAIIPIYAQQYDSEKDFQFDWDPNVKDGVAITKYIGSKREVRIPPSIQNNPVTGIGKDVFRSKNITKVAIPKSVTTIEGSAFSDCSSLTSVTFQGSITEGNFGRYVFPGDLHTKYLVSDGGPGTYKRFAGNETWRKL